MNHIVIVADDSSTIQKVIKITLANEPYEIVPCTSEEELFEQLPQQQPALVFLDFNLSEDLSGYELTTKIKALVPETKVLLLLNTFDTIDDAAYERCGAAEKIVKPFNSNKFIDICRRLLADDDVEELPYPNESSDEEAEDISAADDDQQWTMSHSTEVQEPSANFNSPEPEVAQPRNALESEVSDWGMSVPEVIGGEPATDKPIDLPPVISGRREKAATPEEVILPDSSDLDYPDMAASNEEAEQSEVEDTSPEVMSIEAQIQDEVGEDLWRADEFEDLKREVSSKIEDMQSTFQPTLDDFDHTLFKSVDDKDSISWGDTDEQSSAPAVSGHSHEKPRHDKSELEAMVRRCVKEYMDEMFQKNVEKISWEVIPDLAENLIRQELSKITDKILKDSSKES